MLRRRHGGPRPECLEGPARERPVRRRAPWPGGTQRALRRGDGSAPEVPKGMFGTLFRARNSGKSLPMLIVVVNVHVVASGVEAFVAATLENARASLREPGVARFDVVQREDDPTRFLLIEVYRTAEAPAAHKATAHYATWRDTVGPLMASPRTSQKYTNLAPPDAGWEAPEAR